jgi:glycosyltransferase involved in cell wall biosynthesis
MKNTICFGILSFSIAFGPCAVSAGPDYSTSFESARQQFVHFENKGEASVEFDITATITRMLNPKEQQQFVTDEGFSYVFKGKNYQRGTLVNPHDQEARYELKDPDGARILQKRHITLASGETIDLNLNNVISYFVGLENLTGMQNHLSWELNERGLSVLLGVAEAKKPVNCNFVTTPSDWAKQTRLYRQYFLSNSTLTIDQVWEDFQSQPSGVTSTKRTEEVVFTLTSYPARFTTTWLAIESLLRQEEKPDRIVLNLFEGEFPDRVLPWMIKEQMKRGLEINWCPENYKVHLKYGPTMRKYPNAAVVAFDDDIIYEKERFSLLYQTYLKYNKQHITSYDGRFIEISENAIQPFSWNSLTGLRPDEFMEEIKPSRHFVPEGVGGVLFPPHSLGAEVFNMENALQYSPNDDDIWAYMCSVLTNKLIAKSKRNAPIMNQSIEGSQNIGLYQSNFSQNFSRLNAQRDTLFAQYDIFSQLKLAVTPKVIPSTQGKKRIVIDLQGAQGASKDRGLGKWSLNFAKAFLKHSTEYEVLLALNGNFPDTIPQLQETFRDLLPVGNIHLWYPKANSSYVASFAAQNFAAREESKRSYEKFINSLHPNMLLICSLFDGMDDECIVSVQSERSYKLVTILYDLIPLVFPELYLQDPRVKVWYPQQLEILKKSDHLLTISDYTKKDALKLLPFNAKQITAISSAIPLEFLKKQGVHSETIMSKLGISKPFLLCVMSPDYRKNFDGLVEAFCLSGADITNQHQLVIVSRLFGNQENVMQKKLQQYGVSKDTIVITNFLTDEELISLYNCSKAVICPSHYEGFGLSVLEAMQFGKAVICSNNSSMPEVINHPEALFNSHNTEEISTKIHEILLSSSFRNMLEAHGVQQSRKFSWDISADRSIRKINTLLSNEKQLLIDVSELVQRDAKSGIQRVVRSVLSELLNNTPDGYHVKPVYASENDHYRYANEFTNKFLGKTTVLTESRDDALSFKRGDVFFGLDLSAAFLPGKKDYFHNLRQQGVEVAFCLYDLLPIRLEQYFPGARAWYEPWLNTITEVSDQIVCISKAVADDLGNWIKDHPPSRQTPLTINFFHLGCDLSNSVPTRGIPDSAQNVFNTLRNQMNFLMVGTVEPRKGHRQTLAAFEQLWQDGENEKLIIVGKKGWQMDDFASHIDRHPELNKKLFWLNGISDEYLDEIYKISTCMLCPSEGEGFGLPIVEGAVHNLPLIARDIPVFREVAKNSAFFFSGLEATNLRFAITEWKRLYALKQHPKSDGIRPLTWKESTQQLVEALDL